MSLLHLQRSLKPYKGEGNILFFRGDVGKQLVCFNEVCALVVLEENDPSRTMQCVLDELLDVILKEIPYSLPRMRDV